MRKMIPVYVLQLAMLAAFLLVSYKLSSQLTAIEARLPTAIQRPDRTGTMRTAPLQVEVINSPTVDVGRVSDTIDVNVMNEPTVEVRSR